IERKPDGWRNTFAHAVRFTKVVCRPLGNISVRSSWISFKLLETRLRSSAAGISPSAVATSTGSIRDWKSGTDIAIPQGLDCRLHSSWRTAESNHERWLVPRRGLLLNRPRQTAVDAARIAFENLRLVGRRKQQLVDVALGVVVMMTGLGVDAADCTDHFRSKE